ncbi:MAG: hypothetical protein HY017_01350 [Betaproteobacteria bacterium]|nr:hypothetical protein [Betaproteobacteria bacterium]
MEPLKILDRAHKHFGPHTPTVREMQAFLDPGTALELAALLVALWQYFFPDGAPRKQQLVCHQMHSKYRKCEAPLVGSKYTGKTVTIICQRGHATRIRMN